MSGRESNLKVAAMNSFSLFPFFIVLIISGYPSLRPFLKNVLQLTNGNDNINAPVNDFKCKTAVA